MQSLHKFVCVLRILHTINRSLCIGCSLSILIPCERWNENKNIVYCLLSIVCSLQLTLADIAVAQVFDWPQLMRAEPVDFDKYPKIGQLKARVEQIPEIAEWLRTRPTSR